MYFIDYIKLHKQSYSLVLHFQSKKSEINKFPPRYQILTSFYFDICVIIITFFLSSYKYIIHNYFRVNL